MNSITQVTFADGSTLVLTATTITATDANGVATVYSTSPVPSPTDTEVDLVLSDGSTKRFVPAA
jgi:hypothetical protein